MSTPVHGAAAGTGAGTIHGALTVAAVCRPLECKGSVAGSMTTGPGSLFPAMVFSVNSSTVDTGAWFISWSSGTAPGSTTAVTVSISKSFF